MSTTPTQSASRRHGLRSPLDAFWDRMVEGDGDGRRAYPRVRIDAPITSVVDGERVELKLHDISPGGLQARCNKATGSIVAPAKPELRRSLDAEVSLNDGSQQRCLKVRCQLIHVTLLEGEEDDVAFGFCFDPLQQDAPRDARMVHLAGPRTRQRALTLVVGAHGEVTPRSRLRSARCRNAACCSAQSGHRAPFAP